NRPTASPGDPGRRAAGGPVPVSTAPSRLARIQALTECHQIGHATIALHNRSPRDSSTAASTARSERADALAGGLWPTRSNTSLSRKPVASGAAWLSDHSDPAGKYRRGM